MQPAAQHAKKIIENDKKSRLLAFCYKNGNKSLPFVCLIPSYLFPRKQGIKTI